jgi:hypothetical protein
VQLVQEAIDTFDFHRRPDNDAVECPQESPASVTGGAISRLAQQDSLSKRYGIDY